MTGFVVVAAIAVITTLCTVTIVEVVETVADWLNDRHPSRRP